MIENRDLRLHNKTVGKLFLQLIPQKSLIFYFKADKHEIIRRKPEVLIDDEDYALKYDTYRHLEKHIKCEIVDNNKDIFSVFEKILSHIFHEKKIPQPHRSVNRS